MRTVTNFKALGSVAGDQQLKMLAQAVSFELGLVNAFLDVQGGAAKNARGLHLLGAHMPSAANDPVSLEAVKGYLAQKYTTAADTPTLSDTGARVQSFFHTNMPELDLAWTNLFQLVDLRGSTQDHFDIIGTNAGLSFSQIAPGQPIKVRRDITEAVTTVGVVEYGEGLGILDRWLQSSTPTTPRPSTTPRARCSARCAARATPSARTPACGSSPAPSRKAAC
jgi:hypothetical protein